MYPQDELTDWKTLVSLLESSESEKLTNNESKVLVSTVTALVESFLTTELAENSNQPLPYQNDDFIRSEEKMEAAVSRLVNVHSAVQQWESSRWATELQSQEIQLQPRACLHPVYYRGANKVYCLVR